VKIYGIAVIGCGHMGQAHMEEIYYKDNVSLRWACDRDLDKARLFQKKYGAKDITDDHMKCITEDVDIVIIATYPSSHLMILKACLGKGKHVICEKPLAATLDEGREFVRAVEDAQRSKVLIGHILRHNATYIKAADMISSGAIGAPVIMRMVQNHHTIDWGKYLSLIKETSPIIDCGVHYIDVMQWFTGERITDISGIGLRTENDVPGNKYNYGIMTVRLSGGSVGYYEAGWSNTMSSDNLKEFIGPKGRIRIVYRKDRQTHQEEGDLIEYYRYPEKAYEMINVQASRKPTGAQFDHLVDMIEKDVPANPDIEEVYESFRLAVMADEIIRRGMK